MTIDSEEKIRGGEGEETLLSSLLTSGDEQDNQSNQVSHTLPPSPGGVV
jgi:hypothetical protein